MITFASPLHLFFALCIGHVLADFPLQGEFLSQAKNHLTATGYKIWYWCLPSHAAIHAGFVWALTGSAALGACEFVLHGLIDYLKCNREISFSQDQMFHYVCKAVWVFGWMICFQ